MNFKEKILFIIFITLITSLLITFEGRTGWNLAMVSGTGAEHQIRRFRNVRIHSKYQNSFEALADLKEEKVDVVIMDYLSILNIINQPGENQLKLVGGRLTQTKGRVAFKADDNELRQKFNHALSELIESGTYRNLCLKYFGIDQSENIYRTSRDIRVKSGDDSWDKIQKKGSIRFGMFFNNPPFFYYDQQNQPTGFEVELARAICKLWGIECHFIDVNSCDPIEGLIAQAYDGLWTGINDISSFRKKIEFSEAYSNSGAQMVVKTDSTITGPDTFEGRFSAFQRLFRRRTFR